MPGYANGWSDIPVFTVSVQYNAILPIGDLGYIPSPGTVSVTFPNMNIDSFTQTAPTINFGLGNYAVGIATIETFQGYLNPNMFLPTTNTQFPAPGPTAKQAIHKALQDYQKCMQAKAAQGMVKGMTSAQHDAYQDQTKKFSQPPLPSSEPPDLSIPGPSPLDLAGGAADGYVDASADCLQENPLAAADPAYDGVDFMTPIIQMGPISF